MVSTSRDRTVKIWDANGQLKNTFLYHRRRVDSVAVLPNGEIASGSYDGRIIISDSNGLVKSTIAAHKENNYIWSMVALPNGQLASSSYDKTIKIWPDPAKFDNLNTTNLQLSQISSASSKKASVLNPIKTAFFKLKI